MKYSSILYLIDYIAHGPKFPHKSRISPESAKNLLGFIVTPDFLVVNPLGRLCRVRLLQLHSPALCCGFRVYGLGLGRGSVGFACCNFAALLVLQAKGVDVAALLQNPLLNHTGSAL